MKDVRLFGRQRTRAVVAFALLASVLALTPAASQAQETPSLDRDYAKLPLGFEANRGQTDPQVAFLSRGSGYSLFLSPTGAVMSLAKATPEETSIDDPLGEEEVLVERTVVGMEFLGSNPDASSRGRDPLPGRSNYFTGDDPAQWETDIPTYGAVTFDDVYPGIDLVYYGTQGALEYDFVVEPGRSFEDIAIRLQGSDEVRIDEAGDLVVEIPGGEIRQRRPVVYQKVDGRRQIVPSSFVLRAPDVIGFDVAAHDADLPLVIDPVLAYSTFLGGSGAELGSDIAVDDAGNAYITGITSSENFPQAFGSYKGGDDAFVAKLNPTGDTLLYSTYLGGDDEEKARSIAIDDFGNAYVAGSTDSTNTAGVPFPTTPGAYNSQPGGQQDIFVTKLNPQGNGMVWSTFLGGSSNDGRANVTVDGAGNAYVAGYTKAGDFTTTPGAFDEVAHGKADIIVVKLTHDGSGVVYSTYVGGNHHDTGRGIAIDDAGNAYVCGWTWSTDFPTKGADGQDPIQAVRKGPGDIVVFKLAPDGKSLVYSTLVGGNGYDWPYLGSCIDVDAGGNAHVTGYTDSTDFKLVNPARSSYGGGSADAFAIKVNPSGSELVYSTYLGGDSHDEGIAVAVDNDGNAHYTGFTESRNFTPIVNPVQATFGGSQDAFVTKMGPNGGEPIYSTYVGGSRQDHGRGIDIDAQDNAYVIGHSESDDNFPIAGSPIQPVFGGSKDVVVFKLNPSGDPPPSSTTTGPITTRPTTTSTTTPQSTTTSTTPPGAATISISDVTVTEGNSGTTPAVFAVTLSQPSSQTVTVKYRTKGITATANQDFLDTSGTVTFLPGETSKTVTVFVQGDLTPEPNETFQVELGKASGAPIADGVGIGTIVDDDGGSPPTTTTTTVPPSTPTTAPPSTTTTTAPGAATISISDVTVTEGNSGTTPAVFAVTLSQPSSQTVTVKYRTKGITATANQDFLDTSGTVTFQPGETSKTVTVFVQGDLMPEPNETFEVELGKESGAPVGRRFGIGTIIDDD